VSLKTRYLAPKKTAIEKGASTQHDNHHREV
jgi:hypothetical protein